MATPDVEKTAYRGRFAPSPTGPLHFGSLLAAVASFLDARAHEGQWLLRIEDIDPPREASGASDSIRRSLEAHGLCWDGNVVYQSRRSDAYAAALDSLSQAQLLFPCSCTRAILGKAGSCGQRCAPRSAQATSLRLRLGTHPINFEDLILGPQQMCHTLSDVVLRRKDGLFAYALAVVVDDAWQGITHVLRGADIYAQTSVQIEALGALGYPAPLYGHLPLLCDRSGHKLSKQTGARALDSRHALENLRRVLELLGQSSAMFCADSPEHLLSQAATQWNRAPLQGAAGAKLVYLE
ncbi:MAG: glutamyl-Q tRNA(Asp) synthetase [Halieaceae bacterium]|jgi:glutamyl-Q tRNA(Asp) synthetase